MSYRSANDQRTITTLDGLATAGLVPAADVAGTSALQQVAADYAIAVTPDLADLIDPDTTHDPIAAQFIPSPLEARRAPNERDDPIGDDAHSPMPGIVHRYPDRVLLKAASTCPVYCRFCFRRERVGPQKGDAVTKAQLNAAIDYIAKNPSIWEVIITGGDPLVLSADRISDISRRLAAIPHVAVIRWHTRVPVAVPGNVTPERVEALALPLSDENGPQVFVAIHTNHARELTKQARAACRRLAHAGIALVSQSVLLRGVNDDRETLADLFRACVRTGIKPYYLHQLDPAPGTGHFRVPLADAQALVASLRGHISGLCQPTFVIDIPGGAGKVVAGPSDVAGATPAARDTCSPVRLRDRDGALHRYDVETADAQDTTCNGGYPNS